MATVRDQEITGAVQSALNREGRLGLASENRVQARVEDGVVQLTGTVGSAGERQAAEEAAREVPGVRQVVNSMVVAVEGERTDRQLRAEVERVLANEPELRGNVGCHVDDGVATLLGHITSPSQEAIAIRVAGSVHGVEDVVSALVVSEPVPVLDQPAPDDATLTGRVADALADAGVTVYEGRPEVSGGVVTLTGRVDSREARARAEQAALRARGALVVKNRLIVQKDVASSDPSEATAARVIRALREDGRVSPQVVRVEVVDGIAYLAGFVNSPSDKDAAAEVARGVPGVRHVVNDLVIANWHSSDRYVGRPSRDELDR